MKLADKQIEGKMKAGKVKKWADAIENRIGKRIVLCSTTP